MRAALCQKRNDRTSSLKWEVVQYASAHVREICILENAWLDRKEEIKRNFIGLYFCRVFPSEIVHHILSMVETWRAVDARVVGPGLFKVEFRRTMRALQ
jgi:hypothetical protein